MDEIKKIEADLASGQTNPKDYKVRLAKEIVTLYHGKEMAEKAGFKMREEIKVHFSRGVLLEKL